MKINRLTLASAHLEKQKHFYQKVLSLPVHQESRDLIEIEVGRSRLQFRRSTQPCYYHFALNIPPHQMEEAYAWAQERVNILSYKGQDIVDFKSWNALAFYFYDLDGNIVEFIARKNLPNACEPVFGAKSLLEISEIGLPTQDVARMFRQINRQFKIPQYDGNRSSFCAMGDEQGLFIVVDYRHKKWIPNDDRAQPFPMQMHIENSLGDSFRLSYENEVLEILESS